MQRLTTRAQFEAVMAAGIAARTAHFALHRMPDSDPTIGVVLPKRWAKRAVTRNTLKRQIYSVSEAAKLPAGAYVVRLRTTFGGYRSATCLLLKREARAELQQLFAQVAA